MFDKRALALLFLIFLFIFPAIGQKAETVRIIPEPEYRNVIKFNPTPMVLWNKKNVTFSYERVLNPKQSFTVGLGYLVFNNLLEDTLLGIFNIETREKYGLNFSFEYRFYMTNRNSRPIPDGLYLAPYFSTYLYHFANDLNNLNSPDDDFLVLSGGFYVINIGGEIGYQFVLWKRMTIDLVLLGPSLSYYGGKVNVKGEVDVGYLEEINKELYDKIIEKYPQADGVLIDETFKKHGRIDFASFGFRYLFQIGFVF